MRLLNVWMNLDFVTWNTTSRTQVPETAAVQNTVFHWKWEMHSRCWVFNAYTFRLFT
jgi:hypothetical protein